MVKKVRLRLTVLPQVWHDRPATRGECEPWSTDERLEYERTGESGRCFGFRPCPFVGCSHHLATMVHAQTGELRIHPALNEDAPEVAALEATCSLDVADDGETSVMRIGRLIGTTEEYVHYLFRSARARGQGA